MRCFWDERQRGHAPAAEFFNGALHPAAEQPARVDAILDVLGSTEQPADRGFRPLLRVHPQPYLDVLQGAHGEWLAAGRTGDAFPYAFPLNGRRPRNLCRIDAKLGQHSFDTATPIAAGTWPACYWSAQTALAALHAVLGGEQAAFALTRPPGHHAGFDYFGGYSYLNHAAICAAEARSLGLEAVAILDIDYHHGNGTQDIVAEWEGVAFASIHADPAMDYPYFWGHAEESAGNILNLPLPRGTDWAGYEPSLAQALDWIAAPAPALLIVSFGADTYAGDPISHFALETADYTAMAQRIAALGVPTLIVMEGGYAIEALGANVAAFLAGF
jgi:acetoin utilization deacetylase AcuC-like enzyme